MVPIAVSEEVTIFSTIDSRFAFYNSPYPGHKLSSSLDIFPNLEFGEATVSPVAGEVVRIRKVKAPKGTNFIASKYDVVILIKSKENPTRLVKVLHVDPLIEVGDDVKVGEHLGTLLRSGYFGSHTGAHIHLEVRLPSDPLRARGGFNLNRIFQVKNIKPLEELKGVVKKSLPGRAFVSLYGPPNNGVSGAIGDIPTLIDGGLPYGWVGGHYENIPDEDYIKLAGKIIAKITRKEKKKCTADCSDFSIKVNNKHVGLFFYLFPHKHPEVLITRIRESSLELEEGDEVEIIIE